MKKGFFWITLLLIAATILGGCNTTPTAGEPDGAETVPFEYTTYELDGERFVTLTKYIGEDTDVTVPTAIDGLTVTEIGAECFAGSAVVSVLPEFLITALKTYAAAAIFGGTFGNFAVKYPKVAVFGLLIPTVMKLWVPVPAWLIIVCAVFGTLGISRLFYNADRKKAAK